MSKDLWPDFTMGDLPLSPASVIERAGTGLEEKTLGQVKFYNSGTQVNGTKVESAFNLYAPSLSYHFPFLRAKYTFDALYPVTLTVSGSDDIKASNEAELKEALRKVFNSEATLETIKRLMALSTR